MISIFASVGGLGRFHPGHAVRYGNDKVRGSQGLDLLIGDSTRLVTPNDLPVVDDEAFVETTVAAFHDLHAIEHVVADLTDIVIEAHAGVLNSLVAETVRLASSGVVIPAPLDLDLHEVTAYSDLIDGTARVQVFGDEDPDRVTGGDVVFLSDRPATIAITAELLALANGELEAAADESPSAADPHGTDPTELYPAQAAIDAIPFDRTCEPPLGGDVFQLDAFDQILAPPVLLPATERLDGRIADLVIDDGSS